MINHNKNLFSPIIKNACQGKLIYDSHFLTNLLRKIDVVITLDFWQKIPKEDLELLISCDCDTLTLSDGHRQDIEQAINLLDQQLELKQTPLEQTEL